MSLGLSLGLRGMEERGKEEKRGSRRLVLMYWRICVYLFCLKCIWFGWSKFDLGGGVC